MTNSSHHRNLTHETDAPARMLLGQCADSYCRAILCAGLPLLVFLSLCLTAAIATANPGEPHARLDPAIRTLIGMPSADRHAFARGLGRSSDQASDEVSVVLEYDGDPSNLKAAGAKVRSHSGNIFTADIPCDVLDSVSALADLRYMRAARQFHPMLDVSVPDTGVNLVRSGTPPSWSGYTGKGVVVGFVDSGIDVSHADFKDTLGKTRILYVWDQTTGTTGANHPVGYTYGTEWTSAQIDAGQCTQKDTAGHGTAVASIAAGDGSATGNGWPAYRYVGMAPEADIIVVKSTFYDDKIIDGMNYIKAKANALGKPFVINLSIGAQAGAHDGTDIVERAIDQISGQGAVICTATGNNRSNDVSHYVHAAWTVPARNSTVTANLNVTSIRSNPFILDIWCEGGDSIDYKVTTPNGYSVTKSTGTTTGGYSATSDGGIWLDNASAGLDTYNSDHECFIAVQNAVAGTWKITATGKTINQGGYCDAWAETGNNIFWSTYGDNFRSCSIPGTGSTVITAGGYQTKTHWTNPDGTRQGWDSTFGDFYGSSGEGPTRDGRTKPDLCVPTTRIAAALSANLAPALTDVVEDGVHSVNTGTSMAVPHMVGAVALLLQKDPTSTAAEIKSRLISTGRTDSLTGAVPNTKWGYGKLSVDGCMSLMPLYTTSVSAARSQPNGAMVKMPSQTVSAGYTQMGDRFYIENSDRMSGIQVRIASGTQPGEKDVVTVNGKMDVADGERAITNATVTRTGTGTGTVPKALGMVNCVVGGGVTGANPGVTNGFGINNTGLLVKVWGKVTSIGSDYFTITDGFGRLEFYRELKIRCPGLTKPTSTSQHVFVTGISSLEISGTSTIPVIRVRKQADLIYY